MVDCLRQNFVYCEKRARDLLFCAIANVLESPQGGHEPLMLSKLTREAAQRARHAARDIHFEFSNWETASKAVVNAMLGAGVLLGHDGAAVRLSIAAQATGIAGLKIGFVELTEAYLIELLVGKLGDISTRDHKALAHALFRQFDMRVPMEDLEDRVVILLATLTGRVTLRDNGVYVLTS
jgi:hypothetical protein